MAEPIRISAVSYLNTKPFLHGLNQDTAGLFSLSLDTPAICAQKLISGEAQLGLVPVATLLQLPKYEILPKFCIGANGPVDSVKIYAEQPLEKLDTILLDYQSRTSVALTRVLAQEYWKIEPHWEAASPGYENQIAGTTGAVIIGDRTFDLAGKYAVEIDLAEAWKNFTGLPFVFACWVSVVPLSEEFKTSFQTLLAKGIDEMDAV
ncbi:MAG: menaquinone biosynthetic enzyme MqnA/MqnD family protein, partial [Bacteroidia bacterium]